MSRIYGIQPWHMVDLAPHELRAIQREVEQMNRAARDSTKEKRRGR